MPPALDAIDAAPVQPRQRRPELEAATAQALTEGGDDRILLTSEGRNRYGCAPRPDARLIDFGSSTASVVSAAGFEAALDLHRALLEAPALRAQAVRRLRCELLALSGAAAVPGTGLCLAASGTEVHRLALQVAARGGAAPVQALMVETDETGSAIGGALSAADCAVAAPLTVALRQADGTLRDAAAVDHDFSAHAEDIVAAGGRCLLVLTDLSKTGLLAPSPACVERLQSALGERLDVLVDACQFRLAPVTVGAYLARGWQVAITGSKFVAGPAFCGALLLPPRAVAAGLGFRARVLEAPCSLGLLLRWQAALAELRRLRQVPPPRIAGFLRRWGEAVAQRIADDPRLEALPVAPLLRGAGDPAWDALQTIFPFRVRGPQGWLGREEMARLHRWLQRGDGLAPAAGSGVNLGQPVPCGIRDGRPMSVLRLNASARWIADAALDEAATASAVATAMTALDAVVELTWC